MSLMELRTGIYVINGAAQGDICNYMIETIDGH